MRCSVIGSGVVRLPSPGASEVCSPSVPRLAARLPEAGPELAGEHGDRGLAAGAGHRGDRARLRPEKSRGDPRQRGTRLLGDQRRQLGRASRRRASPSTATAPCGQRLGEKRLPSVRVPGMAANRSPARTAREFSARPPISISPEPAQADAVIAERCQAQARLLRRWRRLLG